MLDGLITAGHVAGAVATLTATASPAIWYLYRRLREGMQLLRAIEAEFRPNGGSTLRDALTRVEVDVARLRAIERITVDASGAASFETDELGSCVWASIGYLDLVDRPIEDVRGTGWSIVIHQEDRDRVFQEWGRVVNERRRFELAFRYVTRAGDVVPVHVAAVPVPGGYYGLVKRRET